MNPSAFARTGNPFGGQEGMTLLDYFAGQALVGQVTFNDSDEAAVLSYEYALEMLKERAKVMKKLRDEQPTIDDHP